jgi:structural maintenance of chromosome 1
MYRSEFEQDQMKTTEERLTILETTVTAERATMLKLENHKRAIKGDITESEKAIAILNDELKELNDIFEDKTKTVDQVKRTTLKAAKVLH